jgi:hypothetical protein
MALLAVEVATAGGMAEGWVQPVNLAGGGAEPAVAKDAEVSLLKAPSADAAVLVRLRRMDLVAAVRGNANADFVTVGPGGGRYEPSRRGFQGEHRWRRRSRGAI